MSITQIYKPYPEYQKHKNIDGTRKRFTDGWVFNFFTSLERSEQVKTLTNISEPTRGLAGGYFLDAVRQATTVRFNETNNPNNFQFAIEISTRKIRDILATKLDNNVMSELRSRNSSQTPKLDWLGEILDGEKDLGFRFIFNPETNTVGFLKEMSFNRKPTWLQKMLRKSIEQMDNSIYFDKPENYYDL